MATVSDRVDTTSATAVLAVVDLALVLVFVVLGESKHGYPPTVYPWRVLGTYAPFAIGWLLVAPLAGVYERVARVEVRTALGRTAGAWVVAALVGQVLRSTSYFHGDADPAFVAVSILVGLVLLVPWRVAVARFQLLD